MYKTKKSTILFISYSLAVFLIVCGAVIAQYSRAETYRRLLGNTYQHAFGELVTSIGEMDSALQKSLYATSPSMVSASCTEIFGKALSAQMAMGELPFSDLGLESTASFITSVGDYALMLSKSASAGSRYTDEQFENLSSLSKSTGEVSKNLTNLYAQIQEGNLSIGELENAQNPSDGVPTDLGSSFKAMESEFPEIPSLIYDGPFSQHITSLKPLYIQNMDEITKDEALEKAAVFCGKDAASFTFGGKQESRLPVYMFYADSENSQLCVEVSVQGGVIVNMTNSVQGASENITPEEAVINAEQFLSDRGYSSMRASYHTVQDNSVIINFAYVQDGTICYTDLIKVRVSLDTGEITAFEGEGYVMNHRDRTIPEPTITRDTAAGKITKHLNILSHAMSVIPSSGKNELFCHEFKCENSDNTHYIVYVNAETGVEEKILILIEDENGTLVL